MWLFNVDFFFTGIWRLLILVLQTVSTYFVLGLLEFSIPEHQD